MKNGFGRALARATIVSALLAGGTGVFAGGAADASGATPAPTGLDKVQHIVVIYLENWSFDSLYGLFPGADGLAQAASAPPQVDQDGQPYSTLPQVLSPPPGDEGTNPLVAENSTVAKPAPPRPVDTRFPADLPNQPFSLAQYVAGDGEGRRPRGGLLPGAGGDRRWENGPFRPGRQIGCPAGRLVRRHPVAPRAPGRPVHAAGPLFPRRLRRFAAEPLLPHRCGGAAVAERTGGRPYQAGA